MLGFDSEKYLDLQSKAILERINMFGDKLYLEFGGKLFDDYHASRVLPGFEYNLKIKLLEKLKENCEVILTIAATDIEKHKIRADYNITYDLELFRMIDIFKSKDIAVNSVVITKYSNQPSVNKFINILKEHNISVYTHKYINNYPNDIDNVLSSNGFGANEYIKTNKPLVIVTAPGPGSGKLAVCLSQCYHENLNNIKAGYAKFETFPVWNLPLNHPLNLAYEAATADLNDINMIDSFHLDKYGIATVNYNRDIESFPIVKKILNNILNNDIYFSPTDMGVNKVGNCLLDESIIFNACSAEIIRRYYNTSVDIKLGKDTISSLNKIEAIMEKLNISKIDRKITKYAIEKSNKNKCPAMAIELKDKTIITSRRTNIMTESASLILNSLKHLSNISDDLYLLSTSVITPMLELKNKTLRCNILNLSEVLMALSVCASTNTMAELALKHLDELIGTDAHCSSIINSEDIRILKSLGINITSEPVFDSNILYNNI